MLWKVELKVSLQNYSKGHIDVLINTGIVESPCLATGFYRNPNTGSKKDSWLLLKRISHGRNLPWLCGRDFNEILFSHEKKGVRDRNAIQMLVLEWLWRKLV